MLSEIFFATGNQHKLKEFEEILGRPLKSVKVGAEEIQGVDGEKVVVEKVEKAFAEIKKPVLVDDTGIYLESLGGFPGVLGKWMAKTCGYEVLVDLANLYGNFKAEAKTFIGFCDGKETRIFVGAVSGRISKKPRGESGFGFDPIFIPEGYQKTQAEMSAQEKNEVSSRRLAIEKLKDFLDENFG